MKRRSFNEKFNQLVLRFNQLSYRLFESTIIMNKGEFWHDNVLKLYFVRALGIQTDAVQYISWIILFVKLLKIFAARVTLRA